MITTTLKRIRAQKPCEDGWRQLLEGLGKTEADDEPLSYARIVEINGIDDALWACRAEPKHEKTWRLFAVYCARERLKHTDDWRAVHAVNIAERHAHGMASGTALTAARETACEAAWAAERAAAREAARGAAWAAARETACEAAWAAAWAAAREAASVAARETAWEAAWAAQTKKFIEMVT